MPKTVVLGAARTPFWQARRCALLDRRHRPRRPLRRMPGVLEESGNPNGGAIALGHPLVASGARILGTLIEELRRGGGLRYAPICSGGRQGDVMIVEVNGG